MIYTLTPDIVWARWDSTEGTKGVDKFTAGVGIGLYDPVNPNDFRKTRYRTVIKADINSLPDYMIITNAKLYLYGIYAQLYLGTTNTAKMYRITSDWSESSLINDIPSHDANAENTFEVGGKDWYIFDITNYVNDVINNTWQDKGLILRHTYDVLNQTNRDSSMVRLAGSLYSDESKRPYIEIEYTKRAPRPPTNLTPTAVTVQNDSVIRFSWQHDPSLEEPQLKYDLEWRKEGGSWQTISQTTANQYYDMPANTFPVGTVYWRVRTYGQNGLVSEWAESSFLCSGKSATPVITAPGSNVNTSQPIISWIPDSQVYYQVQVLNADNSIYWDSGEVLSSATSIQVGTPLQNQVTVTIRVRTKNQFNIWTDWATKTVYVDFGRPAEPSIKLIPDNSRAAMRIQITNPAEANFRGNEIYRRKPGGTWLRIAANVPANGVVYDGFLEGNEDYEYKVRAFNTQGGYTDSTGKFGSIILKYGILSSAINPVKFVWLKYNVTRQGNRERERSLMQFAGRRNPVPEYGTARINELAMSVTFRTLDELLKLISLVDSGDILLYRDHFGRKMYCSIGQIQTEENKREYKASFTLTEVDYIEGV